ncbi:MAG: hypothetical protein IAG13_04545 [Deltaproteobacteria bacterium]|nr:hypothetical protein [Nannocystaceae bacterium]
MMDVTPGWRHVATVAEGDPVGLDAVDPWRLQWHALAEPAIVVAHPSWPSQRHRLPVYELRTPEQTLRFAAGELSAGVWGFYVPA